MHCQLGDQQAHKYTHTHRKYCNPCQNSLVSRHPFDISTIDVYINFLNHISCCRMIPQKTIDISDVAFLLPQHFNFIRKYIDKLSPCQVILLATIVISKIALWILNRQNFYNSLLLVNYQLYQ